MNKIALILAVISTLSVSVSANANTTITFDDINTAGSYAKISNGYSGFNWDNFYAISSGYLPGSGYDTGTVSAPNTALNGYDHAASFSSATAFRLISMDVTKAWRAGITHFDGFVGNTLIYTKNVNSSTAGPTLATFNWTGLNKVTMSDGNSTSHSAIDNVTVSAVPEPETYGMFLMGLGLIGFVARRRRGQQA